MGKKKDKKELRFWIDENGIYEYEGKNLKPSEIITMGCILQRDGLCEFEINERDWKISDKKKEE